MQIECNLPVGPTKQAKSSDPVQVSIVDDDWTVRGLLAEWINSAIGFRCLSQHANGEAALQQLPLEKPAIVLMDINLPDLTGIECVRRLKPLMPDTQFVMLTVYGDSNYIFEALRAGAIGYLLKLTPCDQLIDSLRQVCAGGSPMSGYIARKVVQFFRKDSPAGMEFLSAREQQVLELLAKGCLFKEITDNLQISMYTVNAHVRRIYRKLQVHSRTEAVVKFMESQSTPKKFRRISLHTTV